MQSEKREKTDSNYKKRHFKLVYNKIKSNDTGSKNILQDSNIF